MYEIKDFEKTLVSPNKLWINEKTGREITSRILN
jgi:hypothetical protein